MTRRRRRILIVIGVLVLMIGGLGWLSRPTIDPRFVGRWDWSGTTQGKPTESIALQYMALITFRDDGSGLYEHAPPAAPRAERFAIEWSVDFRGRLHFEIARPKQSLGDLLKTSVDGMLGKPYWSYENRWIVREMSDETFVLQNTEKPTLWSVLKRASPADPGR
jgi:hypothetical protein